MQNIIDFFRENTMVKITFCLSVISFFLSAYNFVLHLYENHKSLEISFGFMTVIFASTQYVQMNFINKSCKQITISSIKIKSNSGFLNMKNECMLYLESEKKRGETTISENKSYTSTTPFYIGELGYYSGCFMISESENYLKCGETIEIILGTNRGKIKKKITTPDSYSNSKHISGSKMQ